MKIRYAKFNPFDEDPIGRFQSGRSKIAGRGPMRTAVSSRGRSSEFVAVSVRDKKKEPHDISLNPLTLQW